MKYLEKYKDPLNFMKLAQHYMDKIDSLTSIKEDLTFSELAKRYMSIAREFLKIRETIKLLVVIKDKKVYDDYYRACKESFLFYIVFQGYSFDVNKAVNKEKPLVAFLPFAFQLNLIMLLQYSDKNLHIEKSRRQGASVIIGFYMSWLLETGEDQIILTTHKDLKSLDAQGDVAKNSTFARVRFTLDKSLFIPDDWKKDRKYESYVNGQCIITVNSNRLEGSVLGKGTAVGSAITVALIDELDVVSDMYPNASENIFGSFSTSSNRLVLYSTYRSPDYKFYKIKESNDPMYDFVELDWRDNPTCNTDWYKIQCSKLTNDPVLIARELDRNPNMSREGTIWANSLTDSNYYTALPLNNKLVKVVGADAGGGTSYTSFVFSYYDSYNGILYLDDVLETTNMSEYQIKDEFVKRGFDFSIIYMDESGRNQATTPQYSWFNILRSVRLNVQGVNNRNMYYIHSLIRQAFENKTILINKDNKTLKKRIQNYSYKEDKIEKNDHSHTGDAISYLYKSLFNKNDIGFI